jgi:hypothetical protein
MKLKHVTDYLINQISTTMTYVILSNSYVSWDSTRSWRWLRSTKITVWARASGLYCALRGYRAAQKTPGSSSDTMEIGPTGWKLDGLEEIGSQGR